RFKQILRAELCQPLPALRIEQPDMVRLRDRQLRRVLDADEPFVLWNVLDQGLRDRGLTGARGAGDDDVLSRQYSSFKKGAVLAAAVGRQKRILACVLFGARNDILEQT